ncbi:LOW QUALITY PROTEIN: hypothetical protein V1477_005412 [Vespula maculifrons]|uniref:Uncharacterized protein n=1 Tax=Vespula maculifrons TaxID=7453 RepID=A0ABD2CPJ4_VESMC
MQQPPRGGTWVGKRRLFDHAGHANIRVESPLARGSPDAATSTRWDLGRKHDRSCLEMSEADGVDSGAICKRGFIHLQFAEKPEAPEAERHLGSWILEIPSAGLQMQQPPRGGTWVGSTCDVSISSSLQLVGPQMQLPPRGGTWVGSTCETSKSMSKLYLQSITKLYIHDRSCLEMSEADGVDSGAICKRGFIHLQFAEKPEAPEAERHLGSWILE